MITLTHKIDIAIEDLAQQICGEAQDLQAELLTAILQEVKTWTPEERLDQCQAIACEVPEADRELLADLLMDVFVALEVPNG